jgi:hypothetical protein
MTATAFLSGRRTGRTTKAAEWARETGGVIVCANIQQAKFIEKHHGVKAMSWQSFCQPGKQQAWIPDTTLVEDMAFRLEKAETKVAELERTIAWLRKAEFKNLYKPHPSSPVFIMAAEVGQHLASSPPPEWKTPHDNS